MATRNATRSVLTGALVMFVFAATLSLSCSSVAAEGGQGDSLSAGSAVTPVPKWLDDERIENGGDTDGKNNVSAVVETIENATTTTTTDQSSVRNNEASSTTDSSTFPPLTSVALPTEESTLSEASDVNASAPTGTTETLGTSVPATNDSEATTGAPVDSDNQPTTPSTKGGDVGDMTLFSATNTTTQGDGDVVTLPPTTSSPIPSSSSPAMNDSSVLLNDTSTSEVTLDASAAPLHPTTQQAYEQVTSTTPAESVALPVESETRAEATQQPTESPSTSEGSMATFAPSASPIESTAAATSTSLAPPPSTSTPPPPATLPATTGVPASPTELEARLQRFCRHTTTTSELRHPIVFGRRVTVSEFLLICRGLTKSPQFLSRLSQREASGLTPNACAVFKATDVSHLAHVFGRLSQDCVVAIPGAAWRGAQPSAIIQLFGTQQGRRAFNLATNISGLPLDSISEVERQSGCFSKKQCNSLLYRGPDHQPKVCTRYETNNLRATSAQEPLPSPVETGSNDVPVNELVPANKLMPAVALPGKSSAAPLVTNPLHLKTSSNSNNNNRKEELGAGPLRPDSTSGPSLVMPVAAGVITACVLFSWSHIRRRKSSR